MWTEKEGFLPTVRVRVRICVAGSGNTSFDYLYVHLLIHSRNGDRLPCVEHCCRCQARSDDHL